ncbi:hypothetical protein FQA47_016482 [Oryzias melastigma]|uniref:Uncharacterized protein n=1 Tax=Oryzias melastigma TaxID=30732 RepID=A0A834CBI9_ORYME|nr:hypothetical protein FQA47_016482 [Oryzias melastigma]
MPVFKQRNREGLVTCCTRCGSTSNAGLHLIREEAETPALQSLSSQRLRGRQNKAFPPPTLTFTASSQEELILQESPLLVRPASLCPLEACPPTSRSKSIGDLKQNFPSVFRVPLDEPCSAGQLHSVLLNRNQLLNLCQQRHFQLLLCSLCCHVNGNLCDSQQVIDLKDSLSPLFLTGTASLHESRMKERRRRHEKSGELSK